MALSVQSAAVPARRTGMPRPYLAAGSAALVLLVIGAVLAALALREPTASYPPGSPQRAIQTYLNLLQVGKVDEAYRMTDLSPVGYVDTSLAGYHQQWDHWSQNSHRIVLVRSTRAGGSATVTVDVSAFSAGPLGSSEDTQRVTFTLSREHGSWRITGPATLYLP